MYEIKIVANDSYSSSEIEETLLGLFKEFKEATFHWTSNGPKDVEILFSFKDNDNDRLIAFLWKVVVFFHSGNYPAVEKVFFVLGKKLIKLYPVNTAVS